MKEGVGGGGGGGDGTPVLKSALKKPNQSTETLSQGKKKNQNYNNMNALHINEIIVILNIHTL